MQEENGEKFMIGNIEKHERIVFGYLSSAGVNVIVAEKIDF